MATETIQEFLSVKELEERYPEEWLLLVDCELTGSTELSGGKVAVHSKCRDDIYRRLKDYSGRRAIHFAGEIPDDLAVML